MRPAMARDRWPFMLLVEIHGSGGRLGARWRLMPKCPTVETGLSIRLKAAYLYNFGRFVKWRLDLRQARATPSPFAC